MAVVLLERQINDALVRKVAQLQTRETGQQMLVCKVRCDSLIGALSSLVFKICAAATIFPTQQAQDFFLDG